jgi:hypothetical protein
LDAPENPNPEKTGGGFRPEVPPPPLDYQTGFRPPPGEPPYNPKEHEAKTARNLAYWLMALLGVSVLTQYGTLGLLVWLNRTEAIPNFEHLFNACFPVIAGLASSAVTYYLTKERK